VLQGSVGQRLVALAEVVFDARQGLGRAKDRVLLTCSGGRLASRLPVAAPGPGSPERGPVRGHQRQDREWPDPGAEAPEKGVDHAPTRLYQDVTLKPGQAFGA